MINCSKCNREIKSLEFNASGGLNSGMEHSKILCSVCGEIYKVVKRPIKRKLTKRERFEVNLFFVLEVIFMIGAVIGLIYSLEKGLGKFSGDSFLVFALYVTIILWHGRIKRLEKQSKGKCCNNNDCDLKE